MNLMERFSFTSIMISSAFLSLLSAGVFGSFGAIVQYLYLVIKEDVQYSFTGLFQYAVMGFFVGMVANELMLLFFTESFPGVVLVSGFIFMKILDFFQGSKLGDLIKFITK